MGDVVGTIVGLAVVGTSEGLAVVGYSKGLAVGVLVRMTVGVLVGMEVGDAEEVAFVGVDMIALVGAAVGGSGRSTPTAITAAIRAAAATNPNETSPSLYSRIICS